MIFFVLMQLPTTIMLPKGFAWIHGTTISQEMPFVLKMQGVIFVIWLIAGIVITPMLKVITFTVPFKNKEEFIVHSNEFLGKIGYHPVIQEKDTLIYKPGMFVTRMINPDTITIKLEEESATVTGPRMGARLLKP